MTIGLDEVGRGAWAGPLVVGAVALDRDIPGLADSKTLSKTARKSLSEQILSGAQYTGLGWVSPSEVDDLGLTRATTLACERALEGFDNTEEWDIVIDGKINYLKNLSNVQVIVNADELIPAVSAASIIAKVARDEHMAGQDELFPGYNFAAHVGYGTLEHRSAIDKLGLSPIHRWSYKPFQNRFFKVYEA